MNNLIKTTRAEWLKLKGLGLTYAAIGLAILSPLVMFVNLARQRGSVNPSAPAINVWEDFLVEGLGPYPKFFLVLYIVIIANRICQTDHKNGGWLLMETQPVQKWCIYFAKYINLLFLTLISILSFFISCYLFSIIYEAGFSAIERSWKFDAAFHLQSFLKLYISSWGTAAFLLFISVIIPGYVWPFGIGILGLILNFASIVTKNAYPFSPLFPELLAFNTTNVRGLNTFLGYSEILSIFWTTLFLLTGYLIYRAKSIKRAFWSAGQSRLIAVTLTVSFSALYFLIEKPLTLPSGEKLTRIQGNFLGERIPRFFRLMNPDLNSEIATIPIRDRQFLWETNEEVPPALYILESDDGSVRQNIILGTGDYYQFSYAMSPFGYESFYRSNRKAENQLYPVNFAQNTFYLDYKYRNDAPAYYQKMEKAWHKTIQELHQYKTRENYGAGEDFKNFKSQLLAIDYLKMIKNYRNDNPSAGEAPSAFLSVLEDRLKSPTELTARDPRFLEYRLSEITAGSNPDSVLFSGLDRGKHRDRLIRTHLVARLESAQDSLEQKKILAAYLPQISDPAYRLAATAQFEVLRRSKKGGAFPVLEMTDPNGKKVSLDHFQNKFVILNLYKDAPSPLFEQRASDHSYFKNLVFISLNVNSHKEKWTKDLQTSKNNIHHFWLENAEIQLAALDVTSFPRLIILDPEGKIYHAEAPEPGDQKFVEMLVAIRRYSL